MVRKRVCWLIFLVVVTSELFTDTVMLQVLEAEASDYFTLAGLDYVAAVEDGIMEAFFDAGHIIFNFGLSAPAKLELPLRKDRASVRVAISGGAGFLIEIILTDPTKDRFAPSSVDFFFTDIMHERVITSGHIDLSEIDDGSNSDDRELCEALGRAVALAALSDG